MTKRIKLKTPWTEREIAHALALGLTPRSVLVVPNCGWTGHEADLLVIEKGLRIIDVEVKISRADLKQDKHKDKWWHLGRPWSRRSPKALGPRKWPDKVWKHYYVMPAEIWAPALINEVPEASGIVTLTRDARNTLGIRIEVIRAAKPNKEAKPISPADAIDIARLASLRMWTALRSASNAP